MKEVPSQMFYRVQKVSSFSVYQTMFRFDKDNTAMLKMIHFVSRKRVDSISKRHGDVSLWIIFKDLCGQLDRKWILGL